MLEHQKKVLLGVSENNSLFRKELIKSMVWLNDSDLALLQNWVRKNFYDKQANIINEIFTQKYSQAS